LNRAGISGDLTDFLSSNGAFRAVKGAAENNESNAGLARQCGKSPVATGKLFCRVEFTEKHSGRRIKLVFQVT
jgi:hypothetical protein